MKGYDGVEFSEGDRVQVHPDCPSPFGGSTGTVLQIWPDDIHPHAIMLNLDEHDDRRFSVAVSGLDPPHLKRT